MGNWFKSALYSLTVAALFVLAVIALGGIVAPHHRTYNLMPEHEQELVERCILETSMDFGDCVETVDRDGRRTW